VKSIVRLCDVLSACRSTNNTSDFTLACARMGHRRCSFCATFRVSPRLAFRQHSALWSSDFPHRLQEPARPPDPLSNYIIPDRPSGVNGQQVRGRRFSSACASAASRPGQVDRGRKGRSCPAPGRCWRTSSRRSSDRNMRCGRSRSHPVPGRPGHC